MGTALLLQQQNEQWYLAVGIAAVGLLYVMLEVVETLGSRRASVLLSDCCLLPPPAAAAPDYCSERLKTMASCMDSGDTAGWCIWKLSLCLQFFSSSVGLKFQWRSSVTDLEKKCN